MMRWTSKVIIQGDSEPALMAVMHDRCALLRAATPRTSLVNSKGSNGAAERAVQAVEGLALCVLTCWNEYCCGKRPVKHILDGETRGMVESLPSWCR